MAKYIPLDALVAEIKKRKNICDNVVTISETPVYIDYYQGKAEAYKETLSFLDSLEVKEVDLEKESLTWEDIRTIDQLLWDLAGEHRLDNEGYYKAVLDRFKAQKGEKA